MKPIPYKSCGRRPLAILILHLDLTTQPVIQHSRVTSSKANDIETSIKEKSMFQFRGKLKLGNTRPSLPFYLFLQIINYITHSRLFWQSDSVSDHLDSEGGEIWEIIKAKRKKRCSRLEKGNRVNQWKSELHAYFIFGNMMKSNFQGF